MILGLADLTPHAVPTEIISTAKETFKAAFRQGNIGYSFSEWAADTISAHNVFERDRVDLFGSICNTKYEAFADSFNGVETSGQMYRVMARIDREQADRQTLDAAGGTGIAALMLADLLDLPSLLPVAAATRAVTLGGRIAESAMKTGAAGLASMSVSEAGLQATQETRPWQESILNILLGGAMSAGAGALGPVIGGVVATNLPPLDIAGARAAEQQASTVGAARVRDTTLEQESMQSALGVEHLATLSSPLVRVLRSPLTESRRVVQDLVETPLFLQKHTEGIASEQAVEILVKMHDARKAQSILAVDDSFAKYRIENISTTKLDRHQFSEEIGKAMRRNDVHEIAEVAQAARDLRRLVFDPLKEEAIKLKLLPENVEVKTATSYLSRVWNTDKIVAQRDEFVNVVKGWLSPQHTDLSDLELKSLSNEITQRILSTPDGRLPYDVTFGKSGFAPSRGAPEAGLRGSLRERVFMIPDELVEPWLISDAERIASIYVRTLAPDLELIRRFGDVEMTRPIKEITEGYARLISAATTEEERIALNKSMKSDIENLAGMRDILRGVYNLPRHPEGLAVRSFRVIRHWNYLCMLGGMTLSSIPDLVRPIMVHGLGNYFKHGLAPLISDLKKVKLAAEEVKLAGTALDMVLSSRAAILGDIMDDYGKGTKFERGLFWATNKFGRLALMSQWNAAMKQFSGIISQSRLLDAVTSQQMTQRDVEWLSMLGINRNLADRIAAQFSAHGEVNDSGVRWANTTEWTDQEAIQGFRSALVKDVDSTIVSPGIGDRPLFANTELGKIVFQFRAFTLASMVRTTLPALQQHDTGVLGGMIMSTALGMLGYALYSIAAGRKLSDDPKKWIADGLERSGIFSWLGDATMLARKMTGYGVTSRYQSRNAWGAMAGPIIGTMDDMTRAVHATAQANIKHGDVTAIRRLLPYNNIFYIRWLFNLAENGINELFGISP